MSNVLQARLAPFTPFDVEKKYEDELMTLSHPNSVWGDSLQPVQDPAIETIRSYDLLGSDAFHFLFRYTLFERSKLRLVSSSLHPRLADLKSSSILTFCKKDAGQVSRHWVCIYSAIFGPPLANLAHLLEIQRRAWPFVVQIH